MNLNDSNYSNLEIANIFLDDYLMNKNIEYNQQKDQNEKDSEDVYMNYLLDKADCDSSISNFSENFLSIPNGKLNFLKMNFTN